MIRNCFWHSFETTNKICITKQNQVISYSSFLAKLFFNHPEKEIFQHFLNNLKATP